MRGNNFISFFLVKEQGVCYDSSTKKGGIFMETMELISITMIGCAN